MLKKLRGLLAGGKIAEAALSPEPSQIKQPVRVRSGGKAIELALGKQTLRLYPETPISSTDGGKNWIIVEPERFCSGVAGFARLERDQTALVGRGNTFLDSIFGFPKSVAQRHLALLNDAGEVVIKPLDGDKKTQLSSVPEGQDVGWLAKRRLKALRTLRSIFGGPILLLPPDEAMAALDQALAVLGDEAFRPRNSHDRPGGLLDLPKSPIPIVVGDIHAQLDNLLRILCQDGLLDGLKSGDVYMLFLGDTVHREGDGELEEMDSSLLTLDLLCKLKARFPRNVFLLRGNHESFSADVGKGGVPQGRLLWQHCRERRGKKYAKRLVEFFDHLAYFAMSEDFLACHAGPPRSKVTVRKLIDIEEHPTLARELVWNRLRRTGRPDGYAKKDVKVLRASLGAESDTPFHRLPYAVVAGRCGLDRRRRYSGPSHLVQRQPQQDGRLHARRPDDDPAGIPR